MDFALAFASLVACLRYVTRNIGRVFVSKAALRQGVARVADGCSSTRKVIDKERSPSAVKRCRLSRKSPLALLIFL